MLTHEHFLKQIQTTPDDPLPRLIYADWLEEQGDVRADLIRLEIERAQLEPWSDRYAIVQRRLRELRPQFEADWLTALDYHWQHYPLFSVLPDEREHRWRLIERFFENWGHPIQPEDNYTHAEIDAAEQRLGIVVPAALRELFTRCNAKTSVWKQYLDLDAPQRWSTKSVPWGVLTYAGDLNGVTEWLIRQEDLSLEDPPIYANGFPFPDPGPASPTLSQLACFLMLESAVEVFGERRACYEGGGFGSAAETEKRFQLANVASEYWSQYVWFREGRDLLLVCHEDTHLHIAARTQQGWEQIPAEFLTGMSEVDW